ncbi:amidohydrolase family protein [Flammeovirgaceae bacterium SG7u.111]|nr:amidohydrolase family protein [Flammeovirgaceae bacterium SG7u.132]WPO35132.1 amidohydrolase family protein [Flammeovirgaceae bacterium SG7u.111]
MFSKIHTSTFIIAIAITLSHCTTVKEEKQQFVSTEVLLEEGTNMAAALSPDKSSLAIDLQGTIWILPVEGGKATAITDGMGDCHEPAWSPDGQKLAFHSYKAGNYHIWTVDKNGSSLTQITKSKFDDREPHWSPNGEDIIFSSDRNGNYDIWKINLTSSTLTALTDDTANDYYPTYSPTGDQIAFVSETKEAPGLYTMKDDGSTKELLKPSSFSLTSPAWSTNGKQITYTAFDGKFSHLLVSGLAEGDTATVLSSDEDLFPFRASWLSEEKIIYTADGKIKTRLIGQDSIGTIPFEAVVTLKREPYKRKQYNFDDTTAYPVKGIMAPVISPDGSAVAYAALGDIYIKKLDSDSSESITKDKFIDIDPCWSPDGNKIAFLSDRGGNIDLWEYDFSSKEFSKLADLENDLSFPAWSPDGKFIAFFSRDTRNVWGYGEIQLLELATGNITSLKNTYFVPSRLSWSPDSKIMAAMVLQPYSSRYREGLSKIMLITKENKVLGQISPKEGRTPAMRNVNGPVWSPDGKYFAYIQDGNLWQLPIDTEGQPTGNPIQLTEELASSPTWTGDSKKILYLATDQLKILNIESKEAEEVPLNLSWKRTVLSGSYVVHAGKLFNGKDSVYQENVDIIVEGNRIKDIVPHTSDYDIPVIDASDKTIIPGLFEMHTHQHAYAGEKLGRIWLSYGITNVREPGADPYDALERKEAWASGQRPGPREFFTGGLTDGSRIYYGLANSVINAGHLSQELERAEKLGYDMIKTYVRMPDSIQKVITTKAHEIGIPVSSHEIYPAMRYNVDAVEHIRGTSRRGYSMKQSNMKATYSDVVQLLAKSQMNITPTIGLQGGFYILAEKKPGIFANRQLNALYPADYVNGLRASMGRITKVFPAYLENFQTIQQGVYKIVKAGGRVTAGTDSPFIPYGTSLHVEMQLFVDGGLSPFQALQSATIFSAEAIGVADDLGSVEKGKLADFVVVDGDPLNHIEDAWNVVSTYKEGIRFDIDELLKPSITAQ